MGNYGKNSIILICKNRISHCLTNIINILNGSFEGTGTTCDAYHQYVSEFNCHPRHGVLDTYIWDQVFQLLLFATYGLSIIRRIWVNMCCIIGMLPQAVCLMIWCRLSNLHSYIALRLLITSWISSNFSAWEIVITLRIPSSRFNLFQPEFHIIFSLVSLVTTNIQEHAYGNVTLYSFQFSWPVH